MRWNLFLWLLWRDFLVSWCWQRWMSRVDSNLFGCGPIREADERDERLFSSASAGRHATRPALHSPSSDFNPLHKHEKDSSLSTTRSSEQLKLIDPDWISFPFVSNNPKRISALMEEWGWHVSSYMQHPAFKSLKKEFLIVCLQWTLSIVFCKKKGSKKINIRKIDRVFHLCCTAQRHVCCSC